MHVRSKCLLRRLIKSSESSIACEGEQEWTSFHRDPREKGILSIALKLLVSEEEKRKSSEGRLAKFKMVDMYSQEQMEEKYLREF